MAYLTNGNLTGKIGNLTGFVRNGKNLFRINSRRTAPPTEKELINRYVFKTVQDWVTPLNPFVKVGFANYGENLKGANAAKSLIYSEALHRDGYNSYIDPSKVRVSSGNLPLPAGLQAKLTAEGAVEFSWEPTYEANSSPRDRIMMLAYNLQAPWAQYELNGAKRYQAKDNLPLPPALPGSWHLYASFISEDGDVPSVSRYLGSVNTQENINQNPSGSLYKSSFNF